MQTVDQSVTFENGLRDCCVQAVVVIRRTNTHLLRTQRGDDLSTGLQRAIGNAALEHLIMDRQRRASVCRQVDQLRIQEVGDADEAGDKTIGGAAIGLGGRGVLMDPAVIHHQHLVRHDEGFPLIMGNVDGGNAEFLLDSPELELHILAELAVEGGERFVEEEKVRLEDKSAGDRDTLLLAAGKLLNAALAKAREADKIQKTLDSRGDLTPWPAPHLQGISDILRPRSYAEIAPDAEKPCR